MITVSVRAGDTATTTATSTYLSDPRYASPSETPSFYSDGSYYYSNSNGSTYYNSGDGYSRYTSPSGHTSHTYGNSK